MDIAEKTNAVISSCKTEQQLRNAMAYAELAYRFERNIKFVTQIHLLCGYMLRKVNHEPTNNKAI